MFRFRHKYGARFPAPSRTIARRFSAFILTPCIPEDCPLADRPAYAYPPALVGLIPDARRPHREVEAGGARRYLSERARLHVGPGRGRRAVEAAQLPRA